MTSPVGTLGLFVVAFHGQVIAFDLVRVMATDAVEIAVQSRPRGAGMCYETGRRGTVEAHVVWQAPQARLLGLFFQLSPWGASADCLWHRRQLVDILADRGFLCELDARHSYNPTVPRPTPPTRPSPLWILWIMTGTACPALLPPTTYVTTDLPSSRM